MNKKILAILFCAAACTTGAILAERFKIENRLDDDIEICYHLEQRPDEEIQTVINLATEESYSFESDEKFWRLTYKHNGTNYSIVRSKDQIKAGATRAGRRMMLGGTYLGSSIDNPNALYVIALVSEKRVDVKVEEDIPENLLELLALNR